MCPHGARGISVHCRLYDIFTFLQLVFLYIRNDAFHINTQNKNKFPCISVHVDVEYDGFTVLFSVQILNIQFQEKLFFDKTNEKQG